MAELEIHDEYAANAADVLSYIAVMPQKFAQLTATKGMTTLICLEFWFYGVD